MGRYVCVCAQSIMLRKLKLNTLNWFCLIFNRFDMHNIQIKYQHLNYFAQINQKYIRIVCHVPDLNRSYYWYTYFIVCNRRACKLKNFKYESISIWYLVKCNIQGDYSFHAQCKTRIIEAPMYISHTINLLHRNGMPSVS